MAPAISSLLVRFTGDQHRGVQIRHGADQVINDLHLRAAADVLIEASLEPAGVALCALNLRSLNRLYYLNVQFNALVDSPSEEVSRGEFQPLSIRIRSGLRVR